MPLQCLWQLPPQRADRPPQYSTVFTLIPGASSNTRATDASFEKHWSSMTHMEPPYDIQDDATVWTEPHAHHATPIDQRAYHTEARGQPTTTPMPPTQWTDPTRPREFGAFIATNSHITAMHRTKSTGLRQRRDLPASGLATSRPKRRPRPLDQERLHEPMNATLLYPQMSPYSQHDDDIGHTTFDYYPRSVSQPVTPRLGDTTATTHDRHGTSIASYGSAAESDLSNAAFSTSRSHGRSRPKRKHR
jgi:hypothetical protein